MIDYAIIAAGFVLGGIIGLTGMGGGALLTPLLVGVFHVPPGLAIASDLVASALMKPFGAAIHLRSKTADLEVVRWLVIGSVPTAFAAPVVAHLVFEDAIDEKALRAVIGVMVVLSALLGLLRTAWSIRPRTTPPRTRVPTASAVCALAAVAGVLVGLTSVGSGSIVSAGLVLLLPSMVGSRLTATDLVQAVPMVWAAALGHLVVGQFDFGVTSSVVIGGIPGVIVGSLFAARARGTWLKTVVVALLMFSGLSMLGTSFLIAGAAAACAGLAHHLVSSAAKQPALTADGR